MKNESRAFPDQHGLSIGLTKREYFAGLAMQGILAKGSDTVLIKPIAIDAVRYADALLAELAKEKS